MRLISHVALIATLGLVLLGQPKPEQYKFGYVHVDCGELSIAHYIVLTTRAARCDKPASGPRLAITVQCCQEIPQTFDLRSWQGSGISASRCIATECVYATSGRVKLAKLDAKGAAGEYDLTFADGDHKSGRFEVKMCKRKRETPIRPCE